MLAFHNNTYFDESFNVIVIDTDEDAQEDDEALEIKSLKVSENDRKKAWVLYDFPACFRPTLIKELKERIQKWRKIV